ncbi:inverse autotransporter beta domain-containing protein, partial [Desulfovibrio sp. OttesenSCG-928-M14]|nr:inverse autotransporter beta domain-containing protein [Desulfovibrio sp. OttesenSCG-928-M14]
DALLPFYDSTHTTIFTQLGARSMSAEDTEDRWIGNFGLGQRWFPAATEEDAGNWMIGYNAFFDYDFTRDHQRGGVGLEAQYDWLRLASNYYFPLSNWKGSEDFDSRFVKERPAEGWDVRMKGYLPFYRNIAITGAYTQWYGDNVGMFGASELEKDPRVWSYGIEYTPIPLISGFITQKSTERGRTDTEFGLNLTYHFNMPWEEQTSHAKVAELRTVGGSRHEFVDRENRIILEYKAKNAYRIEYLGRVGTNAFKFRIVDGFGKYKAGQTVRVSAGGGVTLAEAPAQAAPEKSYFAQALDFLGELISVSTAYAADFSQTYTTDGNGEFIVRLDDVAALPVVLTIQAGNNTQSFTLGDATLSAGLSASPSSIVNSGTSTLTFTGKGAAFDSVNVDWAVVSGPGTFPGLVTTASTTTDASGVSTLVLTADATGAGPIVVKATVNGKDYEVTVTIGVSYGLVFGTVTGGGDFISGKFTTATIPVTLQQNGAAYTTTQATITWTVTAADNSANEAVTSTNKSLATGLAWGTSATTAPRTALSTSTTSTTNTSDGTSSIDLTDIMGQRTITVQASVTINSQTVTKTQTVTFGDGPLSKFEIKLSGSGVSTYNGVGRASWTDAATTCSGITTANYFDTTANASNSNLPVRSDLVAVSGGSGRPAAYLAAGWPATYFWTGEALTDGHAVLVYVDDGSFDGTGSVSYSHPFVCRR